MKRSDAIKALSYKMICPHVILYDGIDKAFRSKAETILNFMEQELGMKPPAAKIDRITKGIGTLSINGKKHSESEMIISMPVIRNEWEPENEEE